MHPRLKDYFHFNKSERIGVLGIVLGIILVIAVKESLHHFQPDTVYKSTKLDSLMSGIQARMEAREDSINKAKNLKAYKERKPEKKQLVNFDPNELDVEGWSALGLSEKQAQVILNYQEKAGGFRSKKDVKKMFVISDELYEEIEPYILLPEELESKPYKKRQEWKKKTYPKRILPKVDISLATAEELQKLYGIGPTLSKRIVDQRTKLGGFVSKNQLNEIYGLKDSVLLNLDTQLLFTPLPIVKLNINTAGTDELKAHPYIRWKVANSIVNFREQHGDYKSLEEIKQSFLINDSLFLKLKPYLTL